MTAGPLPANTGPPERDAPPGSLAAAFDPRRNSVNALRLGLAGLVLVSHTLKLHGGYDPVGSLTGGEVDMGTMAVDGFFALSGFLIVRSYLSSPSTGRYLWRRCLRILPGFWVCLLVSAFVLLPIAQLLAHGTLAGFPLTGEQSALGYVGNNAALLIQQFHVRGLLGGEPVNGSLHTLFYEFLCYLGVAVLGVVGVLRRRTGVVLVVAAAAFAVVVAELLLGAPITGDGVVRQLLLRFGAMFLAGALLQLWARRVPVRPVGGVVAVGLLAVGVAAAALVGEEPRATLAYLVVAPPAVAYLMLVLGSSRRLARIGARRDLSYGLYVYAWPIQVLLLVVGAAAWPLLVYFAAALAISLGMAWLSWTFVESPALSLKSWTPAVLRRRRGRAVATLQR